MLLRVITRRLRCCVMASNWCIKANLSNLLAITKPEITLRSFVSTVPEVGLDKPSQPREKFSRLWYYRNYLLNNPDLKDLVFQEELLSVNTNTSSSLLKALRELHSRTEVEEKDLTLLSSFKEELSNLTYYELLEVLYLYCKLTTERKSIMLTYLDEECCHRTLTVDEKFRIIDLLTCSDHTKYFTFSNKHIPKFTYKMKKLPKPHFVQQCYFLKKFKPFELQKFKFEFKNIMNEKIPELNIIEVGLLCEACKQLKVTFYPGMHHTLLTKALDEFENIDPPVMTSICNCLSNAVGSGNLRELIEFQEKMIPNLFKFQTSNLFFLANSGVSLNYLNKTLYDEVMKRVKNEISTISLTVIERFTFLNARFNINDEEFLKLAVTEFETNNADGVRNNCCIKFLGDLIHFKIYPKDLLEKVLTNDMLYNILKKKGHLSTWAFLKYSVELELPDFKFPEFDEKLHLRFIKALTYKSYNINRNLLWKRRLFSILKQIYGAESIYCGRVMPHFSDYIVMSFDKNFKAQNIPQEFHTKKWDCLIKPPCDDHLWVCFYLLMNNCCADPDNKTISYITETEIRQLSILGYKNIYITDDELMSLPKSSPEGNSVLENLINVRLQEM